MLWILILKFLKIGLFSFGGGYAMLPLFEHEFIDSNLITKEEFINYMTISEMTPGSFGINAATLIGRQKAGFLGSVVSTIAVSLPSLIIILILFLFIKKLFFKYGNETLKNDIFNGLQATVMGFILDAIIMLVPSSIYSFKSGLIFVGSFLLLQTKIHPILVLILAGTIGAIL